MRLTRHNLLRGPHTCNGLTDVNGAHFEFRLDASTDVSSIWRHSISAEWALKQRVRAGCFLYNREQNENRRIVVASKKTLRNAMSQHKATSIDGPQVVIVKYSVTSVCTLVCIINCNYRSGSQKGCLESFQIEQSCCSCSSIFSRSWMGNMEMNISSNATNSILGNWAKRNE